MISQEDVDNAMKGMLAGANHEVSPYDPAFVEFVRVQTTLMLEMRDLLAEQVRLLERSNRAQG